MISSMNSNHHPQELTSAKAAELLHVDRRNVLRMIDRGDLNARLVSEAPRPYYLVFVDAKFLAIQKQREQAK